MSPWWVFINHNGKRTSRRVGDKSAAEEVASKIRAKLQLGEFNFDGQQKSAPVFKDYVDPWFKTLILDEKKISTLKDYKDILRIHVLPAFGNLDVVDVTRKKIKDFLFSKIDEGKAKSTVKHYKAVISGVLNEAVDEGIIPANPAHRLKLGKSNNIKEHVDPLEKDELKKLLDTVQKDKELSGHYPLFLLFGRTGVRLGEGFG